MNKLINPVLGEILEQNLTQAESEWLFARIEGSPMDLMTAFVAVPRFISKGLVKISQQQALDLAHAVPVLPVQDWTFVRLCRVWLLNHLDASDKEAYVRHVETLFDTAEMNELVALYSALPLLSYPEQWVFRATEAVRSNMGVVFDAIAFGNVYPYANFSELAWNQLVLKTIFNDKPVHWIVGLDQRSNKELANTISDFAHERWAAGRQVAAQIWRLVPGFVNEQITSDLTHMFEKGAPYEREAAALVCAQTDFIPAKNLLKNYPELETRVNMGDLTWTSLEFTDLNTYNVPKS